MENSFLKHLSKGKAPRLRLIACAAAILMIATAASPAFAQEQEPKQDPWDIFNFDSGNSTTKSLYKKYNDIIKRYHSALESARKTEARRGNAEEVALIESAINGENIIEFNSYAAKNARKRFDSSIKYAAESYTRSLESAVRKALLKKQTEDGLAMKSVINEIEASLKKATDTKKTVKVYANNDWKESGIEVQEGSTVNISARGSWSSGARKRISKGRWEYVYGDADAYNVQLRVGGDVRRGGTEWTFVAQKSGIIEMRMAPYNRARRGDAKGYQTVTLSIAPPDNDKRIEIVIRDLFEKPEEAVAEKDQEGDKSSDTEKAVTIRADKDWQGTGIQVKKGDLITIKSTGTWTIGKRKNKNGREIAATYGDADQYNVQGKVGKSYIGRGGKEWITTVPCDGELFLRLFAFQKWKKVAAPKGHLSVKVNIKPASK